MCRLFALRASQPTRVADSLAGGPRSLRRQSCGDAQSTCHDDGWGIGFYRNDRPERIRSAQPAGQDPRFAELAAIEARTVLAHVRQASMGVVREINNHPFVCGRWLFAHNGTLEGFPAVKASVRAELPAHLRARIEGDTDSEHSFFLLLAELERAGLGPDDPVDSDMIAAIMIYTLQRLHSLCPGAGAKKSNLNFLLTDGRLLLATRWGQTLWWLHRYGATAPDDGVGQGGKDDRTVFVASEPTSDEAWEEVPDRHLLRIEPDLTCSLTSLGGEAATNS